MTAMRWLFSHLSLEASLAVKVQTEDFNVAHEIAQLTANDKKVGAVVSFVGLVRDFNDGDSIKQLTLEHYPGMTEKALEDIELQAKSRWTINAISIIHRVGVLKPQDQIVLVLVSSAHRGEAFKACEFMMDYLKTQAPFWKKEVTDAGARWVEARISDDEARSRW